MNLRRLVVATAVSVCLLLSCRVGYCDEASALAARADAVDAKESVIGYDPCIAVVNGVLANAESNKLDADTTYSTLTVDCAACRVNEIIYEANMEAGQDALDSCAPIVALAESYAGLAASYMMDGDMSLDFWDWCAAETSFYGAQSYYLNAADILVYSSGTTASDHAWAAWGYFTTAKQAAEDIEDCDDCNPN
jgi:hypothetical protein